MEVHLAPDLEKKLTELAATTGRATDDLVRDVIAGYLEELASVQGTLGSRYDDLKSGRVQPIDGGEAFARLREMSEPPRSGPA